MRPKGLVGLGVLLLLWVIIAYFFSDQLVERGLERTGTSMVGAKVEVDNLHFSLIDLAISLDRLQVTNPNDTWKNLFETGRMAFDMEPPPISRKKIVINDITVADIRIGTKRETDGRVPQGPGDSKPGWIEKAKASLEERIAVVPVLNFAILNRKVNVDSLLANVDLQSTQRLQSLKREADSTATKWRNIFANFDPQNNLEKIATEIKQIKPQEIKGLEGLVSTLERSKRVYTTLSTFKKDISEKKQLVTHDLKQLTGALAEADNLIAEDFDNLKKQVNLGDFTPQNIGAMIFGESLIERFLDLLPYIDLARKYLPVAKEWVSMTKVESPPRFEGQDIRFPLQGARPEFLIEKILISGATNHQDTSRVWSLSGEVKGITSHPRLYGNPLKFRLGVKSPESGSYRLTGSFDHTGDIPEERFEVTASGLQLGAVDLPPRPYLPSRIDITSSDITANLTIAGEQFDFRLDFAARPVGFAFEDSLLKNDVISKLTTSVFGTVDLLNLSAQITGSAGDLDLSITSNLDKVLASRIQAVIGESAKVARAEIKKRLDSVVQPKKKDTAALVGKYQSQINSEIKKLENGINEQLALVDRKKKEMEARIKKEKEKGIKAITKKLKGLIKN